MSKLFTPKIGKIISFLRKHGFILDRQDKTHSIFEGVIDGIERHVTVPGAEDGRDVGYNLYKSIIEQSGISKERWVDFFNGIEEEKPKPAVLKEAPQEFPSDLQRQLNRFQTYRTQEKEHLQSKIELLELTIQEKNSQIARLQHSLQILETAANKKVDLWIKKGNLEIPYLNIHVRNPLRQDGHKAFLETMKELANESNWEGETWKGPKDLCKRAVAALGETDVDHLMAVGEQENKDRQTAIDSYYAYKDAMKKHNKQREDQNLPPLEPREFNDWYCNIYPKQASAA